MTRQLSRLQTENNCLQGLIDEYFANSISLNGGKGTTVNINETVNNWSLFNMFRGSGNTQTTKKYQLVLGDQDTKTDNIGLCQIESEDMRNTSEVKGEAGAKTPAGSDFIKNPQQDFFFERQKKA